MLLKELPQAGYLTWTHVPIGDLKDEEGKSVPSRIGSLLYGWWGNKNANLCKAPGEWNWDLQLRREEGTLWARGLTEGFMENSDTYKWEREGKNDVLVTMQQKQFSYSVKTADSKVGAQEWSSGSTWEDLPVFPGRHQVSQVKTWDHVCVLRKSDENCIFLSGK